MIFSINSFFAYFTWDPSPGMFNFNLPLLHRPILWYGFLFALGFLIGYFVLVYLLRNYCRLKKEFPHQPTKFAEQMTAYVIVGAVIGARLGDVLFYQSWSEIARHPFSIFAIWEGGLASHGGAVGILIALWIFAKRKKVAFWSAVDFAVIPTAIAAVFIRIGNFFNQEILGKPTELPWGIVFLHPADRGPIVPRHPAQLYEALAYLCAFVILTLFWRRHRDFEPKGKLTGLFLILVFGFRFFIECVKMEQSIHLASPSLLTMGQILSIPFLLLGLWLFLRKRLRI